MKTLKNKIPLDIKIISYYMILLNNKNKRLRETNHTRCFSSEIFTKFIKHDYNDNEIYESIKNINISNSKNFIIPILTKTNYWAIGIIRLDIERIETYYFSHNVTKDEFNNNTRQLLNFLVFIGIQNNINIDETKWTTEEIICSFNNDVMKYDSGVYAIACADFLFHDISISNDFVNTLNISYFRNRIGVNIFIDSVDRDP